MNTCKHVLADDIKWAKLTIELVNKDFITYTNEGMDLEVHIKTGGVVALDEEVYPVETLYELVERLGGGIVEAYQSGEEL
jgi:hypothetical protein